MQIDVSGFNGYVLNQIFASHGNKRMFIEINIHGQDEFEMTLYFVIYTSANGSSIETSRHTDVNEAISTYKSNVEEC